MVIFIAAPDECNSQIDAVGENEGNKEKLYLLNTENLPVINFIMGFRVPMWIDHEIERHLKDKEIIK